MFASFDETYWPTLIIKYNGTPTKEEWAAYLHKLGSYFNYKEEFYWCIDCSMLDYHIPITFIFSQISFLRVTRPLSKKYVKKTMLFVPPSIKHMIDLVLTFIKPQNPFKIVKSSATKSSEELIDIFRKF